MDIRTFPWQQRNWDLFDRVPIVSYGLGALTYNNLAKAQILPAMIPENPNDDPVPIESGREVEIVAGFKGDFGAAPDIAATAAINFQVAGEGYLLGLTEEEADEAESTVWDVVSSEELKRVGSGMGSMVLMGPDGTIARKLNDDDYVARLWRPHPRFRQMPLAPLTATADDCLEWLLLSRRSRGGLRTRLSAGWMFLPESITSLAPQQFTEEPEFVDDWEEATGANADKDPLFEELIEIMTSAIKDEDDLAGVVPWLLTGPGEDGEKIRQEAWRRTEEEDADVNRRQELVRSIASGLDWPIEKLTGMGESSYWNAWEIDQSSFEEHMDPLLITVLRALTVGWFRPMLIADGMSVEEANKRTLWRDLSNFGQLSAWDRAVEAYDREALSIKALRKYGRFSEDDKPDDAEIEDRRAQKAAETPADDDSDAPSADDPGPAEPGSDEAEEAASAIVASAATDRLATRLASIDHGLLTRIVAASDQAVTRVLEKAGARVRSRVTSDKDLANSLAAIDNEDIGLHLGRFYVVEQLQFGDEDLIPEDSFDKLGEDLDKWIQQAQDETASAIENLAPIERDLEEEEEQRTAGVGWIIGYLLGLAARRFFSKSSEPETGETSAGKVNPGEVIAGMSIAGGGGMEAPEVDRFEQGIGNGTRSTGWLAEAGFFTEGFVWLYGDPSARSTNFEPHLALDGFEFEEWSDPNLSVRGTFPATAHYYPQDHGGCLCFYEKIIVSSDRGDQA